MSGLRLPNRAGDPRAARDHFTATEPEQFALNVDPDTGEVVEESEVAET